MVVLFLTNLPLRAQQTTTQAPNGATGPNGVVGFHQLLLCTDGLVKAWGYGADVPLGYTVVLPGKDGGSCIPTTPTGACLAVPEADFPACGSQRAYFQGPAATYEAYRHGYTVSPAEIGSTGKTIVVDASLPPYSGTVVFDGIYHLRGDVQFINGTVTTRAGTVFWIDGKGGSGTFSDDGAIAMVVQDADLRLTQATLRASCGDMWHGIMLTSNAQLHTVGAGQGQIRHTVLQDAAVAVSCSNQNSHYYLTYTDFINNGWGLYDYPRNAAAGEKVQNCAFKVEPATAVPLTNWYGLYGSVGIGFWDLTYAQPQPPYYGNYAGVSFTNNTFDRLHVGIYGTAGNATIINSNFTNCWYAAAYSTSLPNTTNAPVTLPMVFTNNTITLPAYFPNGYTTTAGTTAYGISAMRDATITANTIKLETLQTNGAPIGYSSVPPTGTTVASRRVGVALRCQGIVQDNTINNLNLGIQAETGNWWGVTDYDFSRNTIQNLLNTAQLGASPSFEGVTFVNPGNIYGYPAGMAVTMRCNSFASISNTPVKGIWVKQNVAFPSALGMSGAPNGNRFEGAGFPTAGTSPYLNRVSLQGSTTYYSYNTTQEFTNMLPGSVINGTLVANVPGTNACGGSSSPGVYARPHLTALTPAALQSKKDSLVRYALPALQEKGLLNDVLSYYRRNEQYTGLESYLATMPAARHSIVTAGNLALFCGYEQTGQTADSQRVRQTLNTMAVHDAELLNYLRLHDAEQLLRSRPATTKPRPLAASAEQALRLAAASGTSAARPACQLLQFYDPNCRCVLPTEEVSQQAGARRLATTSGLGSFQELYPNPAGETLTVRYVLSANTTAVALELTDALGRLVLRQALPVQGSEATISVRALPTGLYQARLLVDGHTLTAHKVAVSR